MTETPFSLLIGNKNYSSWSLRAWLALRRTGVPFREQVFDLGAPDFDAQVRAVSPAGRVPILRHGELTIQDSLAICEYLAEQFPAAGLWPAASGPRAVARAVSAEMHAGFADLRASMPMNVRRSLPRKGRTEGALRDIDRIQGLWRECRARFGAGGEFLFAGFTIADCMYAPVVTRCVTYAVELDPISRRYVEAVTALPEMREWQAAAAAEPWVVPEDEV